MVQNNILIPPESIIIPAIRSFGERYFGRRFRVPVLNSETEINAGFGIADIVFFQLNKKVVDERRKKKIHPIHSEDIIKTLLLIKNKKKISVTYLLNTLPFSESKLKYKILRFLEDHDLIRKTGDGNYKNNFHYTIGLNHSIAIEAKIKNWRRGLYQAYRYKWFANASYLALHKNYIKQPKKNIHLFKKLNVGLLSVSKKNVEGILYYPTKEKPQSKYMKAVAFEKLLAKSY